MNSRERIKLTLEHKEPDKIPKHDGLWGSTIERWYKEGLPKNIEVDDYFGYEFKVGCPDTSLQFKNKIIDETDEFIIERDHFGEVIKNFKDKSTTPQIIDSPIKDKKDWHQLKERLRINDKRGISFKGLLLGNSFIPLKEGLKTIKDNYEKGRYMLCGMLAGFDLLQRYMGMERLCIAIATDPQWIRGMVFENAKFIIEMFEHMEGLGYKFDGVFLFDDLGYKNTTIISPNSYKEIIMGADKLICDYFHNRKMKIILHSCGCVKSLIHYFIEAGIDCLQPLEVKAGMDLIELKKSYGDNISFMGGIDTRLFTNKDLNLIENEIKTKFEIAKKGGGYIYHSDHSIPDNVSFSRYKEVMGFVEKYREY